MKQTHRNTHTEANRTTANKLFSGILATFMLLIVSTSLLAETQFDGNLKSVSITNAAEINGPPTARFTYSLDGDIITFDASESTAPDGVITEYKWDFGNGLIKSGPIVSQTISNFTGYETLTVVDGNGSITIRSIDLPNLNNELLAHFTFNTNSNGQWYNEISGNFEGSTVGSVTPKPGGYSGNCIETSTHSNSVSIPMKSILNEKEVFTFQYYIKVSGNISVSQDSGLYFYSPNNGNLLQLIHEVYSTGAQITYRNSWGTVAQASYLGPDNLTPNKWYKMEVIVDFPNSQIRYYKDDNLVGTLSDANVTEWTLDNAEMNVLFKSAATGTTLSIDEYKIYSGSTQ